jgi:hypothetical protein
VDMESEAVREEFRTEDAVVKSSGTMKKRRRGRHIAAGQRGESKELTRGNCGSRRKLAAACRKLSRRSAVTRCKGNVFGGIRTQGNCGPRKELATAGKKITRCARVARYKKQNKAVVAPRSPKGRTFAKRRWKCPECNRGIRNTGTRRQLFLKI